MLKDDVKKIGVDLEDMHLTRSLGDKEQEPLIPIHRTSQRRRMEDISYSF